MSTIFTLPTGSWKQSSELNREVWALPDHTAAKPNVVIFQPRPNNGGDFYGYTIKYVRAVDCEDGVVRNISYDTNTRLPVQITPANLALCAGWHGVFRSLFNDNPVETDAIIKTLQLPSSVTLT
jgi:hypothetical protein